jgi:hypothetical protein
MVEPIDAIPPEQRPADIIAAPPPAWLPALKGCEEWRLSSCARAGIDAIRRAAYEADKAVELLGDAVRMETEPTARALLENLRLNALHYLVPLDHVARGGDLRRSSAVLERHARGFGARKGDDAELELTRAARQPFHLWARAGGIKAPSPIVEKPEPQPSEVREDIDMRRILKAAGTRQPAKARKSAKPRSKDDLRAHRRTGKGRPADLSALPESVREVLPKS